MFGGPPEPLRCVMKGRFGHKSAATGRSGGADLRPGRKRGAGRGESAKLPQGSRDLVLRQGEHDREPAAAADPHALGGDAAGMRLHNGTNDHETKAGSATVATERST